MGFCPVLHIAVINVNKFIYSGTCVCTMHASTLDLNQVALSLQYNTMPQTLTLYLRLK